VCMYVCVCASVIVFVCVCGYVCVDHNIPREWLCDHVHYYLVHG